MRADASLAAPAALAAIVALALLSFASPAGGVVMAFAFSELLTLPLMRSQFSAASAFLEQVRIRVTDAGPGLGPGVNLRARF